MIKRFRSKIVEIEAIQWDAKNSREVEEFAEGGFNFFTGDDKDGPWAEVWNHLTGAFIPVNLKDYVIKGTQGEFYPCDPGVLRDKYEEIDTVVDQQSKGLYEGEFTK